ncbi:HAD family hydrolase [Vibrio sp. 10N.239.311.G01]|uniref:HAD family hydrolase n=3 Tax=unclassified Vibrio TaxID=2614977 RepID=UPI0035526C55
MKDNNLECYKNLVDKVDIVSFDIFDTAIFRDVINPVDIFKIIEQFKGLDGFYNRRILAEKNARKSSSEEDVSIEEIYRFLPYESDLEKRTELDFCSQNSVIFEVYKYALKKGKKIFFISDMYLDEETISNMLHKCGYTTYDQLHISGVLKKSKATGSLYDYVRSINQLSPQKWLHIGDNLISDISNAKSKGLLTLHYVAVREKYKNLISTVSSVEKSIIRAIQINYLENNQQISYWNKFSVLNVSHMMYLFTSWIVDNVKDNNYKNIHFLSRDGYIPFEIYEIIQSCYNELPKPNYLYASRSVFQYSELLQYNKDDCVDFMTAINPALGYYITPRQVFSRYNLDMDKVLSVCLGLGLDIDEEIQTKQRQLLLKKAVVELFDQIKATNSRNDSELREYLKQSGVANGTNIDCLVDVGWRGSIHKSIEKIKAVEMDGFYFGTIPQVYSEIKSRTFGYAFNLGLPGSTYEEINRNIMMFEFIFSAPHGSLVGFKKDANNEGAITPILEESCQQSDNLKVKKEIRNGVIDIANELVKYHNYIKSCSIKESTKEYLNFIDNQEVGDLIAFSKVNESLGVSFSEQGSPFVSCYNQEEFNENYKSLIKNSMRNLWKGAILIDEGKGRKNLKARVYTYMLKNHNGVKPKLIRIMKKINES